MKIRVALILNLLNLKCFQSYSFDGGYGKYVADFQNMSGSVDEYTDVSFGNGELSMLVASVCGTG